ncbi:hypothetical protein [Mailhella sp.]|uniref:hypothetical protein n=1 Tax=Mailhella sp. TaxID=1981029 RepID=UPI0040647A8F
MIKTNTETVRKIMAEFPNLQNEKKTLEGNHEMTFREAIRALYPTLRAMNKRGFTTREIAEKLKEYGVYIELSTLSKYMHDMAQDMSQKSKASSTRRVKKPASQPAVPVTNHAPATPNE